MTPVNEDDGRKAEPISEAVQRAVESLRSRNNPHPRLPEKSMPASHTVIKKAKLSDAQIKEIVQQRAKNAAAAKNAPQPVVLRQASELPIVAGMLRIGANLVYLSRDGINWRATTNYDRLVQRLTAEAVRISQLPSPPPTSMVSYDPIYKSLTSPTILPKNISVVKPADFTWPKAPAPVVPPPKE